MNARFFARAWLLGALALLSACAAQDVAAPPAEAASPPALPPAPVTVEHQPEKAVLVSVATPDYAKLGDEIDQHLYREVVDRWYPRIVDAKQGGFGPTQRFDWTPAEKNERF